jgi:hypothetical protein
MLRTSIEKMTTYISTKYGNEAAQEWTSRKKINLLEPAYSQAIQDRHAGRVRATREWIELKLRSLRGQRRQQLKPRSTMPLPIAGSSRNCKRWTTKFPRVTLNSMMRSKWDSQTVRRYLTAICGAPTERLLTASRKTGVKSTPCYWASAPKCWLTRWSKMWIGWLSVSHLTLPYSSSSSRSLYWSNPTINTRQQC